MPPDLRAKVSAYVQQGHKGRDAVRMVKADQAGDIERGNVAAEFEQGGPTDQESAQSRDMGLAESLSFGQAGRIKGALSSPTTAAKTIGGGALGASLGTMVGGPLGGALGATAGEYLASGDEIDAGHAEHTANITAAQEQDPGAYGEGHLGGDVINTLAGLAAPASSLMADMTSRAGTAGAQFSKGFGGAASAAGAAEEAAPTGGGVMDRLRAAVSGQGGLGSIFGRKAVGKVLDADTAAAAFPKATPPAAPEMPAPSPWGDIPAPSPAASSNTATAPMDDIAEMIQKMRPMPAARPDMPADVMAGGSAAPRSAPIVVGSDPPPMNPRDAAAWASRPPAPAVKPQTLAELEAMLGRPVGESPEMVSATRNMPIAAGPNAPSGGTDVLVREVSALPPQARVQAIHAIAKQYGPAMAEKVARMARVSLKLSPL